MTDRAPGRVRMLVAVQEGASHEQAVACAVAATGRVRAVAGRSPSLNADAGSIDVRLANLRSLRRLRLRLHEMGVPAALAQLRGARVLVAALRPHSYVPLTRRCRTLDVDLERAAVDYYAAALVEAGRDGASPVAVAVSATASTAEALRAVTSLAYAAAAHPEEPSRLPGPHGPAGTPAASPVPAPILDLALANAWRRATYRTSVLFHDAPAIEAGRGHLAVVREPAAPTSQAATSATPDAQSGRAPRPAIAFLGRTGVVQV